MIRTLPTAVCGWRAVAVESYAAPAKADPHASISSRLYPFLHYKRGRDGVEMPRMGYQRGPYKRYGYGLCCASRKFVFTTKHRRASPVRATKSAASPLCCSEEGGVEGRPRYQTSHPPAYPIYHARVQTVRCHRRSARGIRSLLKPALRPQRQIHTRRFPLDLAATTALNHPPGRARPGQVSCRTPPFSWAEIGFYARGGFAQEKGGVRHETRTGYSAAAVWANGGT